MRRVDAMSPKERWLDRRGGRTEEEDVERDARGEYVRMHAAEGGTTKVYLPKFD